MLSRRIAAVVGVSAALLLGMSGGASAGAIAWPGVNGSLNASNNTISVKDAACDDDSVYANWKTQGGDQQKINNTSGCGSTVTKGVPIGDGTTIFWRVCVDKSWPTSDSCSPWKSEKI
jgi:hypothetical protein